MEKKKNAFLRGKTVYPIALFGEGARVSSHTPLFLRTVEELLEQVGMPSLESLGLSFAMQTLLYHLPLIYFQVEEEGFSREDYFLGFHLLLQKKEKLSAVCLPGVGDDAIFQAALPLCEQSQALLLTTEKDLFDYLISY